MFIIIGVARDRTRDFFKYKQSEPFQKERFKPKNKDFFKNFQDRNSDESENPSVSLLDDGEKGNGFHNFNSGRKKQNGEKGGLPPMWVDREEEIEENIGNIK